MAYQSCPSLVVGGDVGSRYQANSIVCPWVSFYLPIDTYLMPFLSFLASFCPSIRPGYNNNCRSRSCCFVERQKVIYLRPPTQTNMKRTLKTVTSMVIMKLTQKYILKFDYGTRSSCMIYVAIILIYAATLFRQMAILQNVIRGQMSCSIITLQQLKVISAWMLPKNSSMQAV